MAIFYATIASNLMKTGNDGKVDKKEAVIIVTIIITVIIIILSFLYISNINNQLKLVRDDLVKKTTSYESQISELNTKLTLLNEERDDLEQRLNNEIEKNESIENEIGDAIDTVKDLKKLSETDKELLQKYSKVYFLNEHYIPKKLTNIDKEYLSYPDQKKQIHGDVYPFLEKLLQDAEDDNVTLKINSAYRSFNTQSSLKSQYSVVYGAGSANQFSADQGYSEHQLGTAVDFSAPSINNTFVNFDKTEEYKWLEDNAYKYGFTLSYPEGNSYYVFEPWHWRFVGVALAKKLHRDDKHFYDLDQREIDKYLLEIFN